MLRSVVDLIGNTPVIPLRRLASPDHARILVKLEAQNPTGSMKDRAALAIVKRAAEAGRLRPGDTIVECTSGSTGTSLSSVAVAMGYRCLLVTSDAFSEEKLAHMRALGAELDIFASDQKRITAELVKGMIERSRDLSLRPGHFWADQFNNTDVLTGYRSLADELWDQTGGKVGVFVQAVGTSGSLRGTAERLREHRPDMRIVAVEPAESPVLSGGVPGANRIEGIGMGYVVPLWRAELVDEIIPVSAADAMAMARRLAQEEGIFAGASTGANVVAALALAERSGPNTIVATLMIDTGIKYLSTDVYRTPTPAAGSGCT
jgi:cysteine synthase